MGCSFPPEAPGLELVLIVRASWPGLVRGRHLATRQGDGGTECRKKLREEKGTTESGPAGVKEPWATAVRQEGPWSWGSRGSCWTPGMPH